MQATGVKENRGEIIRKQWINTVFSVFIALVVFRLFVFFTFFNLPGALALFSNLLLGGIALVMTALSIPDMSKGIRRLWFGLLGSLAISYLTHFTGLEYACNTVIFLGCITVLPQIDKKELLMEGLLLVLAIYMALVALFVNRSIDDRVSIIYLNPNTVCFILVLYQCMLVAYARRLEKPWKLFIYVVALSTVYVQVQFGGRSSLLSTVLLFGYLILQRFFDKFSRKKLKWLVIALCVGGILFAYLYAKVLYKVIGDNIAFLGKDIFTGREKIWSDAFDQLSGHWFFGIGNNLMSIPINGVWGPTNLHNQMMGYLVTFGLFSAFFYALLLGALTARAGKAKRKTFVALIVILIITSYFDTVLYSTDNMAYLPIVLTAVYMFDGNKERRK